MSTNPLPPHIHREVLLDFAGRRLVFATSLELFSSHQVDVGTRLLLRTIEPLLSGGSTEGARLLDLGCGYGPLGVALATLPRVAAVCLADRDALALDFARENARRNGLGADVEERVTFVASLGLDGVAAGGGEAGYDLVAANIPGKAGEAVIASMLLGALGVLRPGGLVAIVVIEPVRDFVAGALARHHLSGDIEVTLRRDTADYSVFHYRPTDGASFTAPIDDFAAGVYDRGTLTFEDARGEPASIPTVQGLPDYDRANRAEVALTRRLPNIPVDARVLVSNVGQGYLAAYLLSERPRARFLLVDRDLLALRSARRALLALGCVEGDIETRHLGAWDADAVSDANVNLVMAVLHEGGSAAAVEAEYVALVRALAPGGRAVLVGSSTAVTRLLACVLPAGMKASRTRHRGTSVLEVVRV